jgi:hypothetical protein
VQILHAEFPTSKLQKCGAPGDLHHRWLSQRSACESVRIRRGLIDVDDAVRQLDANLILVLLR